MSKVQANEERSNQNSKQEQPQTSAQASVGTTGMSTAEPKPIGDAFDDLERLRLPQDFANTGGVRRKIVAAAVRKPLKQEFIRVHPENQLTAAVLNVQGEREGTYLVDPDVLEYAMEDFTPTLLVQAISRQGANFLWPLRLPKEDRADLWAESAMEGARNARERWTRIRANMAEGCYRVEEAVVALSDPEWPAESFKSLVRIAFKDRYIDSEDHPVLKMLRGEL